MANEAEINEICSRVFLSCACQGVRRSARVLTQLYDHALAPVGIKATQFPILVALQVVGSTPLSPLADALVMDRTTLTRNLKSLEERGLIQVTMGKDRRVRLLSITPSGREILGDALELWKVAQAAVETAFGPDRLYGVLDELFHLTSSVRA